MEGGDEGADEERTELAGGEGEHRGLADGEGEVVVGVGLAEDAIDAEGGEDGDGQADEAGNDGGAAALGGGPGCNGLVGGELAGAVHSGFRR